MFWFIVSTAMALPLEDGRGCATLSQLQRSRPLLRQEEVPRVALRKSGKLERDSVCNCSNSITSDNFIVKWGSGVSEVDVQNLLNSFEYAWQVEVNQMGYLPPTSTDQYLFNVYIADTGSGTPSDYGAAGYFTSDNDGYPMIVIAKDTLGSDFMSQTVAHEFFHALQGRVYRYNYDETGPSAWYWEATANWAEGQVYPGDASMAGFLIGYSFFPHLPVNYFNYPDSGVIEEFHQYGAFIFPLHLTEIEADVDLIWSSWNDQGVENDPMLVLNDYLQEYGTDIDQAWLNHIAHMSVWDYQEGAIFQQTVEAYQPHYPEGEHLIAAEFNSGSSGGWRDGPSDIQPMRYGHNTIRVTSTSASSIGFGVRGEDTGTQGSIAQYGATVAHKSGAQIQYFPLDFVDNQAQITVDSVLPGDELFLTIGAWTQNWNASKAYSETFPYQYFIGAEDDMEESEDDDRYSMNPKEEIEGWLSGCSTVEPFSMWAMLGLLGILRRRR